MINKRSLEGINIPDPMGLFWHPSGLPGKERKFIRAMRVICLEESARIGHGAKDPKGLQDLSGQQRNDELASGLRISKPRSRPDGFPKPDGSLKK